MPDFGVTSYRMEDAQASIAGRATVLGEAANGALVLRDEVTLFANHTETDAPFAVPTVYRGWAVNEYGLKVSWPADGTLNREEVAALLRAYVAALEDQAEHDLNMPPAALSELEE